jgi:hypothetical protein
VIEPLARLRLEVTRRTPGWQAGPHSQAALAHEIAKGLSQDGTLHVYARGNRLLGFVLSWREARGWNGEPLFRVMVEVEPEHNGAAEWATDTIAALGPALHENVYLPVHASQYLLRARLVRAGLGVDSVRLVGAPGTALVMLMSRWAPPANLDHLSLRLARLRPQHVAAVTELRRVVFGNNPEFCWFGARKSYLAQQRAELMAPAPRAMRLVVLDRDRVVGFLSADVDEERLGWGRSGGLDLVLADEVQRLGIAKTAYRVLLEHLVHHKADVFQGGTAQPAVMHMGRAMGRVAFQTNHRPQATFPLSHFAVMLDGARVRRRMSTLPPELAPG